MAPAPGDAMAVTRDQLAPGAVLDVPAGASLLHRSPYRLRITRVPDTAPAEGRVYVVGTVLTVTGRPARTHPRHAWLDLAACRLITPAPAPDATPDLGRILTGDDPMDALDASPSAYQQRAAAPATAGRARLDDDAAGYLAALAASARTATEAATAPDVAPVLGGDAACTPSVKWADLAKARADRLGAARAAARYLYGAHAALEAVLNGHTLMPGDLKLLTAGYGHDHPSPEILSAEPPWSAYYRPALPTLCETTTGHADLDTAVAVSRTCLTAVYAAAERVDTAIEQVGRGIPPEPVERDDYATALRLPAALIRYADALALAARYGHTAP